MSTDVDNGFLPRASRSPRTLGRADGAGWLKVRIGAGETYAGLRRLMRDEALHTVCEEARCPNQGECWTLGTATFMVLGSVCTRNCGFCAIQTGRRGDRSRRAAPGRRRSKADGPQARGGDHGRPRRPARRRRGVVADTVRQIRLASPGTSIEILISDLNGQEDDIRTVVESQPEILSHNVETVPRLQRPVRRRARWDRGVESPPAAGWRSTSVIR